MICRNMKCDPRVLAIETDIFELLHFFFYLAIQTQMAFELGIFPQNFSDDYLSYDSYELALRAAIERLKC